MSEINQEEKAGAFEGAERKAAIEGEDKKGADRESAGEVQRLADVNRSDFYTVKALAKDTKDLSPEAVSSFGEELSKVESRIKAADAKRDELSGRMAALEAEGRTPTEGVAEGAAAEMTAETTEELERQQKIKAILDGKPSSQNIGEYDGGGYVDANGRQIIFIGQLTEYARKNVKKLAELGAQEEALKIIQEATTAIKASFGIDVRGRSKEDAAQERLFALLEMVGRATDLNTDSGVSEAEKILSETESMFISVKSLLQKRLLSVPETLYERARVTAKGLEPIGKPRINRTYADQIEWKLSGHKEKLTSLKRRRRK